MAKYTKTSNQLEVINWEEFMTYGNKHSDNIVDGIPWSFKYEGHPVTSEGHGLYSISCKKFGGQHWMHESRVLIINEDESMFTVSVKDFEAYFVRVMEPITPEKPSTTTAYLEFIDDIKSYPRLTFATFPKMRYDEQTGNIDYAVVHILNPLIDSDIKIIDKLSAKYNVGYYIKRSGAGLSMHFMTPDNLKTLTAEKQL